MKYFLKNKNTKTKFIILRLANGFGKPIDPNSNCWKLFINDVCKQAIINNKIKLNSRGNQTRNFINISELIRITNF